VIQYFVIAQDLAETPNVTINTGTLNSATQSVNLVINNFPIGGTLKSFLIREGIQGEYLIGTGETYTTLTGADGIFNKINNSVVTGNVTIKITSDLTETGAVALNEFDNNFSVTIKPNSEGLKTITGAYAGGLIRFNGADNIIIDGRYNDAGNNLTFFNNSSSYNSLAVLHFISKGIGQGSQNNTIRNCNIYTLSFSAGGTGIYVGDDTPSVVSSGADNDNYTIVENNIYRCRYGIAILGKSTGKNNNITIENNELGYKQLNNRFIGKYGVYLKESDGVTINKNKIFNIIDDNDNMGKLNAIFLSTGVQNCNITKNNIYNVHAKTNDAQGASGIEINTGNPNSNITIVNNSIGRIYCEKGISAPMSYTTSGISVLGTTGGIKIYNNSICVAGNNTSSSSVNISEGIYFASGVTGIELINNSFYNSTLFTQSVSKAYAIYSEALAPAFTQINYNNYYVTGSQAILGYLGGDKTTLEDWKTATGKDGNSISVDPLNLNDNNLQPVVASPLIGAGTPIELVTTDINNIERSLTNPAIGAYETTTSIPTIDNVYLITGNSTAVMGIATTYTAKIFEEGLTDNVGQGANVQCWIGYSTVNSNPSTWNDSLWMVAGYNGNTDETNGQDEFLRGLSKTATNSAANLSPGTYYIAARFKIRHSGYKYAGYSASGGGEWDGTIYVSPTLTITDPSISWVNLESDNPEQITLGTTHSFYGRVVIDGITNLNSNAGSRLKAWVGFNDANTNPSTWEESKWISGTVSGYRTLFHATQDQYEVETGSQLSIGTYYTATRFKLDNDDYVYGGKSTDGGGIWQQGVNENGVLQVVNGQIEWANLKSPATLTKADGSVITILGHVKVPQITNDCNDESPYLKAWIGFSSSNTNPNTWTRWIPADFDDCDYNGDAHIYAFADVEPVGVGTFYYAFRYQYGNGEYKYGGYNAAEGGFWDGITNVSGVLTVTGTIISDYPYFEGFEDTFPVVGWRSDDWGNWSLSDFTHTGLSGLGVWYDHTGSTYVETPKFTLSTNMRAKFWWMDQDWDYTPDSRLNNLNDTPLILGHDTTYFEITTNNGETWQTLCWLSKEEDETQFNKQIVNLSSFANQQVKFRWRDETNGSTAAFGMILDDFTIEKIPDANNLGNIPANNLQQHSFGTTGVTLQFTVPNGNNLGIDVDRIQNLPGGDLPEGILAIAPRYWIISVEEGSLSGGATYTITLDLTGIGGISNYSKIHLLKRNDPNDDWADYGVPNDISQQPILKWTGLTSFSEFGLGSTEADAFPVELSSFTATVTNNKTVLNWTTATEINVNSFKVERCIDDEIKEWEEVGTVEATGNSNTVKEYTYTDKNVLGGTKFKYRLKVLDNDGSFNYSKELNVEIIPRNYELFQNYPNPFNPVTKIKFSLPKTTKVNLTVYNALGELVNVLIDENFEPGYFEYLFNASGFASGVYFYRLKTPEIDIVKKMMILK
nr:T9SS type A sorting domain-containing protein [Melioribacteraceae bacterium]